MTLPPEAALLARRKQQELAAKLDGLSGELEQWRRESGDRQPLEKHQSQIGRVTAQLGALCREIETRLAAASGDSLIPLTRGQDIERDILELYRIWEFFRAKLALRKVGWLHDSLEAADELAWACYQPACLCALAAGHVPPEQVKEPPLVFFNGGSSPFAMPRGFRFDAEDVPGESLRRESFRAILQALPIPVIGIPWFQVAHLPELVAIGHETGHLVEEDLDLTGRLDEILLSCGLPAERQALWQGWLGEIFADLWGTLATGPAFVGALLDFLAEDPAALARQRQDPARGASYPTTHLRVRINLRLLQETGFAAAAGDLERQWQTAYGTAHAMALFEADIEPLVGALLTTPFPELDGRLLPQVLQCSPQDHRDALSDAGSVLTRREPRTTSIRGLVATARLAFESDPAGYKDQGAQERILAAFRRTKTSGPRSSSLRRDPAQRVRQDVSDQAAGGRLLTLLHPPAPST